MQPHVNVRVAAFTIAVCAACAVMLWPGAGAPRTRSVDLAEALKDSARGSDRTAESSACGARSIVVEVSLAVVLLVGAGLMIRTVQHLAAIDPGFDASQVLTARVSIPRVGPDDGDTPAPLAVSARVLLERVRALPGVTAASLVSDPPLSGLSSAVFYTAEGQPAMNAQQRPRAYVHRASPDFFATLQIPVKTGRAFLEQEARPDANVVVVSENVATRFWPGRSAVGKRIKIGG